MEEKLVYAAENKIYLLNPKGTDTFVAERTEKVKSLCVCNNRLFDATGCEISDTLSGELVAPKVVPYANGQIIVDIEKIFSVREWLYAIAFETATPSVDGDVGSFYHSRTFDVLYDQAKVKYNCENAFRIHCPNNKMVLAVPYNSPNQICLTGQANSCGEPLEFLRMAKGEILSLAFHQGKLYGINAFKASGKKGEPKARGALFRVDSFHDYGRTREIQKRGSYTSLLEVSDKEDLPEFLCSDNKHFYGLSSVSGRFFEINPETKRIEEIARRESANCTCLVDGELVKKILDKRVN
jgi:hypothetical protein